MREWACQGKSNYSDRLNGFILILVEIQKQHKMRKLLSYYWPFLYAPAGGRSFSGILPKTLRFDFLLGGNATEVTVFPQQMKQEPYWAGSLKNLKDVFNYGTYRFKVYDAATDKLLFSKGFCTLFRSGRPLPKQKNQQNILSGSHFPYPREVRLSIEARQWEGDFKILKRKLIPMTILF